MSVKESSNLVLVEFLGGLGNQLFQYATARAVCEKAGAKLRFDLRPFQDYGLRKFELDRFQIQGQLAQSSELQLFDRTSFSKNRILRKLQRTLSSFKTHPGISYREKQGPFVYDESVFAQRHPLLLRGYWQSEKYFRAIRNELLNELQLKMPWNEASQAIFEKIQNTPHPVSLHIRRGDYITNPEAARFHGHCSLSYYEKAMEHMQKRHPNIRFFIFSDDIDWCKKNLKMTAPVTYVDANPPAQPEADLMLMKSCSHHILANSSFSWWGAWLCTRPEQQVIAPKRWVAAPDVSFPDILPEAWERLEN